MPHSCKPLSQQFHKSAVEGGRGHKFLAVPVDIDFPRFLQCGIEQDRETICEMIDIDNVVVREIYPEKARPESGISDRLVLRADSAFVIEHGIDRDVVASGRQIVDHGLGIGSHLRAFLRGIDVVQKIYFSHLFHSAAIYDVLVWSEVPYAKHWQIFYISVVFCITMYDKLAANRRTRAYS